MLMSRNIKTYSQLLLNRRAWPDRLCFFAW